MLSASDVLYCQRDALYRQRRKRVRRAVIRFRLLHVRVPQTESEPEPERPVAVRVACNAIIIMSYRSYFHDRVSFVILSSIIVGWCNACILSLVCD